MNHLKFVKLMLPVATDTFNESNESSLSFGDGGIVINWLHIDKILSSIPRPSLPWVIKKLNMIKINESKKLTPSKSFVSLHQVKVLFHYTRQNLMESL